MSTDKSAAAIKELVERWMGKKHPITMRSYVSDLTALIEEHYVSKEDVNQEVERRIAEMMPSEEELDAEVDRRFPNIENPHVFGKQLGFGDCYFWLHSRLTQKTEGGGE